MNIKPGCEGRIGKGTIVYIQHAQQIGGSVISLLNLIIDASNTGYNCYVVCPTQSIAEVYCKNNIRTIICPIIPLDHNTAYFYRFTLKDLLSMSKKIILGCYYFSVLHYRIRKISPDIIHLNSSVLSVYAILFKLMHYKVVWHIRERIPKGYIGIRRKLLKIIANRFADSIIFISQNEWNALQTDKSKSCIVYNYVNVNNFLSYKAERKKGNGFKLLTLGGISKIKGTAVIVESLKYLPGKNVVLQILGAQDPRMANDDKTSYNIAIDELLNIIKRSGNNVEFIPSVIDVRPYLFECNALVFWGIEPHFPRPIYEAWLFNKPVIAFNTKSLPEEINSQNALLIEINSADKLAEGIMKMMDSPDIFAEQAKIGHRVALEKFTQTNFTKIAVIYNNLIFK